MNEDDLQDSYQPLAEINIIPFVDIMLVLLVIFMITAPLFTPHLLQVTLPEVNSEVPSAPATPINLTLNAQNQLFLNDKLLDQITLQQQLQNLAQQQPPPNVQLNIDKQVAYQRIAEVLGMLQQAGIANIGLTVVPAVK